MNSTRKKSAKSSKRATPAQEAVFLGGEGSAWYLRNQHLLPTFIPEDPPLKLLSDFQIKPKRVLEIGSSNGWRLAEIERRYGCECVGVDPGAAAVRAGRQMHPRVKLLEGIASELPIPRTESFDVVIMNYVFHWISRQKLLAAVAEIDRVLKDQGFLIIGDFLPDYPLKNRYHHVRDRNVFTYKMDYAQIFTASSMYQMLGRAVFDHDQPGRLSGTVPSDLRAACSLLVKSHDSFYGEPRAR